MCCVVGGKGVEVDEPEKLTLDNEKLAVQQALRAVDRFARS